jgi:hypothetical protein
MPALSWTRGFGERRYEIDIPESAGCLGAGVPAVLRLDGVVP